MHERALGPPLLLASLLVWPVPAATAPAPLPRPLPAHVTPGRWLLCWGGADYPCTLAQDGTCAFGPHFRGVWRWEPRTRTLSVVEWTRWSPERESVWYVRLDANLEGVASCEAGVTLPACRVRLRKGGRP